MARLSLSSPHEVTLSAPARWTFGLCFIGAVVEGFDIQSMGVAAPTLAPALRLAREQLGEVFSASILGLFIGAAVLGRAADIVGRKKTFIVSLLIFGIFSLATAFAVDLRSLLVIRVLTGLGLGGAMPTLIALTAEVSPSPRRSGFVMMMSAGLPMGGALAGALAVGWDWRFIFLAGGIAPLLLAPLVGYKISESSEFVTLRIRVSGANVRGPSVGAALFGSARAGATISLWIAFFFTLFFLYLLLNWLPTLMAAEGLSRSSASLVSLLFNLGGGIGALALGLLLNRAGRYSVLASGYVGAALATFALARGGPDLLTVGTAGFAAGFFGMGAQLALFGLAPGFYSTAERGTGVGAAVAIGRLGAIAGPLFAAQLLRSGLGPQAVFFALLPAVAIGAAGALVLPKRRPDKID